MTRGKLLFLATEDWFVRSHFMHLLRRAKEGGYEPIVLARRSDALGGVKTIDAAIARGSLNLADAWREARFVRDAIESERPILVHAIALRPIVWTILAGAETPRALALTGRGSLAVSQSPQRRLAAQALARLIRDGMNERTMLLVENEADRLWVEGARPLPDARVMLMPGAGVDPDVFHVAPEPAGPIVVGVAARLIRSKGVDIAVEAIKRLREDGLEVSLRIAGEIDADNPERYSESDVNAWRNAEGVSVLGKVQDIDAFWAACHIACLPSRGGEGLPRSLLEAAACGKPIVTTAVPGCADFVRDGETGVVVAPENAVALADGIERLATGANMRRRMGAAAHERVVAGYTTQKAADCAAEAWRRLAA